MNLIICHKLQFYTAHAHARFNKQSVNLEKSKVFAGDIIMNKIADPGATFYVDDRGKPMSLAMNLFLLKFNPKNMLSKFVYFYLIQNFYVT